MIGSADMSKHKHREKDNSNIEENNNFNNNLPFGLNFNQLLGLLGNQFDINGLNQILSMMNNNGIDINSFSNNNQSDNNSFSNNNQSDNNSTEDENIRFLRSIRMIADKDKQILLDQIIEKYQKGDFKVETRKF